MMIAHRPRPSARRQIFASALLLALCLAFAACRGERHANEALLQSWLQHYNSHDIPGLVALYAPEGAYSLPGMIYPVRSRDELRKVLDTLWRTAPNMRITAMPQVVAGGDAIAFVWDMSATPQLASKPQRTLGASFLQIENGKIRQQLNLVSR